ncbi:MAG TPA: hypothetical protein VF306_16320 [Pirellulales bacterium]
MIPDGNNVYGVVQAPKGLWPLWRALQDAFGDGAARWRKSGYDGHEIIQFETEWASFETEPLGSGEFLFNGGVGGSAADAERLVSQLSSVLNEAGVKHVLELYDDDGGLIRDFKAP